VASSWILFFSYQDDARSNTHQRFKKIRPVGAALFRADGQAKGHDELMLKLNVAFGIVEELKTNLMSLVIFISLIICSTCFGH